ncbi:DUF2891 domain-containing protein [Aurantiacibacter poecillastricola]|uniref:DUF2891 domain-containing protein n=1 Tax=Aurantiacibacter poecillastricola TaxID=3064385 RepID=UPI00273E5DC2|nr:DUF2891 domain-containing protein [Aurantiacibacter sp. 219JJ12-13]MDP5260116.1 DUF2891 domain-containing protein [Aurantiacibacter sp. 219JJ12-13]
MRQLDAQLAIRFARTALGHVEQEYPNSIGHVLAGPQDAQTPSELHPAFYGSFDWHSCVHSWWTLLTLRRLFPHIAEAGAIAGQAEGTFTAHKLAGELAYAQRPSARGFERPYGWAWLHYLHLEASRHEDRDWAAQLEPLARHFAQGYRDYLPKLAYPITTGTHANTAFALTLSLDWACAFDSELEKLIADYARANFGELEEYRGWDLGGDFFLSPVLSVALLMMKIMPRDEYAEWFARVLPEGGWLETACAPVTVSDPTDGKMAHLDGLNLSRAWALCQIAPALSPDPRAATLEQMAEVHFAASLDAVDGHYMGSHWLASFALLALLAK